MAMTYQTNPTWPTCWPGLNEVMGLERIRFLTSHPSFMSDRIIQAVAELPKVCEHINLPVQAGDDQVLSRMRRPYTRSEYQDLVHRMRDTIPEVSVSTDIIVGFPGETEDQYQRSLDLVAGLRLDKVHLCHLLVPYRHYCLPHPWMTMSPRRKRCGG